MGQVGEESGSRSGGVSSGESPPPCSPWPWGGLLRLPLGPAIMGDGANSCLAAWGREKGLPHMSPANLPGQSREHGSASPGSPPYCRALGGACPCPPTPSSPLLPGAGPERREAASSRIRTQGNWVNKATGTPSPKRLLPQALAKRRLLPWGPGAGLGRVRGPAGLGLFYWDGARRAVMALPRRGGHRALGDGLYL